MNDLGFDTAPFFDDVTVAPAGGRVLWLRTSDGVRIRVGLWRAGSKGTVLLFPGRTEYIEKYGPAAQDLAQRGYAMLAVDWRGQGLADRPLPDRATGHVRRFTDYQRDVAAALAAARQADLPKPYYLLGHSMGGCIGLRALHERLPVAAAAFSGPMWGIRIATPLRPLAWFVGGTSRYVGRGSAYAPGTSPVTYVAAAPFTDNMLTTDAAMFAFMQRQVTAYPDLALGGPSLHWLYEALRETRALRRLPAPDIPCYTAIGSRERIIDIDSVRRVMAAWPKGRLDMIDGAEHEIMMESPALRAQFYDRVAQFFDDHRNG